jgi:hypothetical protein
VIVHAARFWREGAYVFLITPWTEQKIRAGMSELLPENLVCYDGGEYSYILAR